MCSVPSEWSNVGLPRNRSPMRELRGSEFVHELCEPWLETHHSLGYRKGSPILLLPNMLDRIGCIRNLNCRTPPRRSCPTMDTGLNPRAPNPGPEIFRNLKGSMN